MQNTISFYIIFKTLGILNKCRAKLQLEARVYIHIVCSLICTELIF